VFPLRTIKEPLNQVLLIVIPLWQLQLILFDVLSELFHLSEFFLREIYIPMEDHPLGLPLSFQHRFLLGWCKFVGLFKIVYKLKIIPRGG